VSRNRSPVSDFFWVIARVSAHKILRGVSRHRFPISSLFSPAVAFTSRVVAIQQIPINAVTGKVDSAQNQLSG
jgi:hypothetical protein